MRLDENDPDQRPPGALTNAQFDDLARVADKLAETLEVSADLHEQMASRLPGAREHSARERRLAAAEREAAVAYRRRELPPDDVRRVIRESANGAAGTTEQRMIDAERHDTEVSLREAAPDARQQQLEDRETARLTRQGDRDRRADERDRDADHREVDFEVGRPADRPRG
ncbi:hypothetical protein [Actinoplanes sp. NPDC049681]|uniref:hypothetical protein n=1 Tax=Actinoplanes sp. NPDC049681 TaxID=3363905 RepID=UPI00378A543E